VKRKGGRRSIAIAKRLEFLGIRIKGGSLDGYPSWEIILSQIDNFASPPDDRYHLETEALSSHLRI